VNPWHAARTLTRRAVSRIATNGMPSERTMNLVLLEFDLLCRAMNGPRVLELGVHRSHATRSTRHDSWVPNASEYVGTDIQAGPDVDVVADVHALSATHGVEAFDAIISCSTFEHFKYPHRAAHEVLKTLKVGGALYVQTHQSYPLHAHPFDYFRYTKESLAGLFGTQMGFRVTKVGYEFPTRLMSRAEPDLATGEAYLNVCLAGQKVEPTPTDFVYEL